MVVISLPSLFDLPLHLVF